MTNEIYYGKFKDVVICLLDYLDYEYIFDVYAGIVMNKIQPAIKTMFSEKLIAGYYFSRLDDIHIILRLSSHTWDKDIDRIKKILDSNELPSEFENNDDYISDIDAHTYEILCSLFIYFLQEGYPDVDEVIDKKTDLWTFMLHNIFGISDMQHSFKSVFRSINLANVAYLTEDVSKNRLRKAYLIYIKIFIKELLFTFFKKMRY